MRLPFPLVDAGARLLTLLSPERAHNITIDMLEKGLGPKQKRPQNSILQTNVAGLQFDNPLGLAAGFDKNARVPDAMLGLGFGFVEVGAVTPKPQSGNDQPRVFRLREDLGVINRYGFNNDGLTIIAERLRTRLENKEKIQRGIVGINLGANKLSEDRVEDYVISLKGLNGLVDFYTVNISSPNTPGLRALQDRDSLMALLACVIEARDCAEHATPVFLKIAPDITERDKSDIADIAIALGLDALIISNTTVTRNDLFSPHAKETGGLSGAPLFAMSTRLLGEFYQEIGHTIPLIGVGGIASPRDAYRKILAGASLIQLYTALIYQGPGLVQKIINELPNFLESDGFTCVSKAVGAQFR